MRRIPRHILIPAILLVYLAIMAILGLDGLRTGATTLTQYILTIAVTLGIIVLLYFFIKKRDRLREERLRDLAKRTSQSTDNNIEQ